MFHFHRCYDLLVAVSSSCWLEADLAGQGSGGAYNTESYNTHHIAQNSVIYNSFDFADGFKFGQETRDSEAASPKTPMALWCLTETAAGGFAHIGLLDWGGKTQREERANLSWFQPSQRCRKMAALCVKQFVKWKPGPGHKGCPRALLVSAAVRTLGCCYPINTLSGSWIKLYVNSWVNSWVTMKGKSSFPVDP